MLHMRKLYTFLMMSAITLAVGAQTDLRNRIANASFDRAAQAEAVLDETGKDMDKFNRRQELMDDFNRHLAYVAATPRTAVEKTRSLTVTIPDGEAMDCRDESGTINFIGKEGDRVIALNVISDVIEGTFGTEDIDQSLTYMLEKTETGQLYYRFLEASVTSKLEGDRITFTGTLLFQNTKDETDVPEVTVYLSAILELPPQIVNIVSKNLYVIDYNEVGVDMVGLLASDGKYNLVMYYRSDTPIGTFSDEELVPGQAFLEYDTVHAEVVFTRFIVDQAEDGRNYVMQGYIVCDDNHGYMLDLSYETPEKTRSETFITTDSHLYDYRNVDGSVLMSAINSDSTTWMVITLESDVLEGTYSFEDVDPAFSYVLEYDEDGNMFYYEMCECNFNVTVDGDMVTFAGKGLFRCTANLNDVPEYTFSITAKLYDEDDETGIRAAGSESDFELFNIAGERVDGTHRGVVIRNGRKYLQK